MKTLYIHIGTCKTGTTSLQVFLAKNIEKLKNGGIVVPDSFCLSVSEGLTSGNIAYIINDNSISKEKKIKKIIDIVNNADGENVLLSCECIWIEYGRDTLFWKMLAEHFNVRVICYLRNQVEYVVSMIRQQIKCDVFSADYDSWIKLIEEDYEYINQSHESYAEIRRHIESIQRRYISTEDAYFVEAFIWSAHYYEILLNIEKYVGKENIVARLYGRDFFDDNSIYVDFIHCIGMEWDDEFIVPQRDYNLSLDCSTSEMKRIINASIGNQLNVGDRVQLLKALLMVQEAKTIDDKCSSAIRCGHVLDYNQIRLIDDIYKMENLRLSERYLNKKLFAPIETNKMLALNEIEVGDVVHLVAIVGNMLNRRLRKVEGEITSLQECLRLEQEKNKSLMESKSWRITAPLRKIDSIIHRN